MSVCLSTFHDDDKKPSALLILTASDEDLMPQIGVKTVPKIGDLTKKI